MTGNELLLLETVPDQPVSRLLLLSRIKNKNMNENMYET
jgi:hypothetical protein